jgi:hypothetical protein
MVIAMNRLLRRLGYFIAANMIALTTSATATDIGEIIRFNKHLGIMAGCTEPEDAKQIKSFGTDILNDWKIQRYVEMNSLEIGTNGRISGCTIVNRDPKENWKIVNKISVGHPTSAWFCVESTIDYSDQREPKNSFETKTPCFWVWLLDKKVSR